MGYSGCYNGHGAGFALIVESFFILLIIVGVSYIY